jgi:hypothetical protein
MQPNQIRFVFDEGTIDFAQEFMALLVHYPLQQSVESLLFYFFGQRVLLAIDVILIIKKLLRLVRII